ncbi:hypothetical protein ACFVMC_28850 [Nocardia sp. NPDC127579]|uniref:hypothetical protein n=1 Tax=Nocardia sp. NPDC127579 TaxID=3345402 RepID=UPI0036264A86
MPFAQEAADAALGSILVPELPALRTPHPEVERILAEVPDFLGVPFVSPIFQALAHYPDHLTALWLPTRGLLTRPGFGEQVRAVLAGLPAPDAAGIDWADVGDIPAITGYTETFAWPLPKLLTLVTIWYGAVLGEPEASSAPSFPEGAPLGVHPGARNLPIPTEPPTPDLASVFAEIRAEHELPRVLSYYRALGHWPEFLPAAWERLRPIATGDMYASIRNSALRTAEQLAADFPLRIPAMPGDADVRAILAIFRSRMIPALLLDTALIKGLLVDREAMATSAIHPDGTCA